MKRYKRNVRRMDRAGYFLIAISLLGLTVLFYSLNTTDAMALCQMHHSYDTCQHSIMR